MFQRPSTRQAAVRDTLAVYEAEMKTSRGISSIEDMQKFVEDYPKFKQMSNNVSKHVAVVSEMARAVDVRRLMELSELEQDIAAAEDREKHFSQICTCGVGMGRMQQGVSSVL
jgi:vacuolar protein sorting-associated protein 45